jgi:hypothetical protein
MRRGSGKVVAGSPLGPFCFHSTEARTKRSAEYGRIDQPFDLYIASLLSAHCLILYLQLSIF